MPIHDAIAVLATRGTTMPRAVAHMNPDCGPKPTSSEQRPARWSVGQPGPEAMCTLSHSDIRAVA
jgi:hypothetical protein